METTVFLAVIAAAALHAGWNALLKIGLDRFLTATLIQIGAGLVALCALPLVALPQASAWPWIALSALLHIGYNFFLARAYQYGDLGQVYPIARGSSPLMVALRADVENEEQKQKAAALDDALTRYRKGDSDA